MIKPGEKKIVVPERERKGFVGPCDRRRSDGGAGLELKLFDGYGEGDGVW
jgi:hypothetical protein